jgi:hypothetical protein
VRSQLGGGIEAPSRVVEIDVSAVIESGVLGVPERVEGSRLRVLGVLSGKRGVRRIERRGVPDLYFASGSGRS